MKNLRKLQRENLKQVMGGHTCPGNTYHIIYNGYHACCLQIPTGNPCTSTSCLVPVEMCESGLN